MPPGKQQCLKKEFPTPRSSPLHGRFPFFSKPVRENFCICFDFFPV